MHQRARRILNRDYDAHSRQKQGHHDENWDDGPCQLYLSASVNLCRPAAVMIAMSVPEFHNGVGEQSEYNHKRSMPLSPGRR
jgi:hypothetical protein